MTRTVAPSTATPLDAGGASPPAASPRPPDRWSPPGWRGLNLAWRDVQRWGASVDDRTFLAAMLGVALALRVPRLGIAYWGDEAISVGIASHPLHQIPAYLRFDGSPPLYYVLLHFWMGAWGTSAVATHVLSLLVSLVAIPVAWWCARALWSRGAGRPAALLAAVSPYLAYYGTETRMYSIVAVASMLAVTGFVRALRAPPAPAVSNGRDGYRLRLDPARWWVLLAAASTVVVLYTHNWGLFLAAAMVTVGTVSAWRGGRTAWRRTVAFAALVAAGYAPWVPSFVWQLHHTGAPWAPRPGIASILLNPLDAALSATTSAVEATRLAVGSGGRLDWEWVALWLAAVATAVWVAHRRPRHAPPVPAVPDAPPVPAVPDAPPVPAVPDAPLAPAVPDAPPAPAVPDAPCAGGAHGRGALVLGAGVVGATIAAAWVVSQFVHAWASRYLGVAVGPLLVVAAGVCTYRRGRRLLPAMAATMALTALPVLVDPPAAASTKSNVAAVDAALRPHLSPGDLVVSTAPSELPVIAYYLPAGLTYASALGPVSDPRVVDWVNLTGRLAVADPRATLARLLGAVPPGGRVLLVNPLSWATTETPARYAGIVAAEGIAVNQEVLTDPELTVVRTIRPRHPAAVANPVEGILLVRAP